MSCQMKGSLMMGGERVAEQKLIWLGCTILMVKIVTFTLFFVLLYKKWKNAAINSVHTENLCRAYVSCQEPGIQFCV